MKRHGNLYHKIYDINNLVLADKKAQRGKRNQKSVIEYNKNRDANLMHLRDLLESKTYRTSKYTIFQIKEEKVRDIYRLPYFPDRICHHAIMNITEPIFVSTFTSDTYNCIKGRGIHKAVYKLKHTLKDKRAAYYLQLDIKKFYPSVKNEILKKLLRKKFKDADLLWLLDEIIDSSQGLPIGNLLSQFLANFYLTYFDHWIKEVKREWAYYRYADDLVFAHWDKLHLHKLAKDIQEYLWINLNLEIKPSYIVAPINTGLDFLGYEFYHTHTLMRKRIKKRFANMMINDFSPESKASYMGWADHCDSKNLVRKLCLSQN